MGGTELEQPIPSNLRGELDPTFFKPSPDELAFLRAAISEDENEIRKKVYAAQSWTYAIYPYPCIRWFQYTNLMMSTCPAYPSVVKEGRENPDALFLDLGCCMGTDVRKLVHDGFPASRVIGSDLRPEFIDAGYALFGDRVTLSVPFFVSDVFELSSNPPAATKPSSVPLRDVTVLNNLLGRMAYIHTGSLFHLFSEDTQRALATRLTALLRVAPEATLGTAPVEGCVIFGKHQGKEVAGVFESDDSGSERYGHNVETWTAMWHGVFEERYGRAFTNEHLQVQAEFKAAETGVGLHKFLFWSIRIV